MFPERLAVFIVDVPLRDGNSNFAETPLLNSVVSTPSNFCDQYNFAAGWIRCKHLKPEGQLTTMPSRPIPEPPWPTSIVPTSWARPLWMIDSNKSFRYTAFVCRMSSVFVFFNALFNIHFDLYIFVTCVINDIYIWNVSPVHGNHLLRLLVLLKQHWTPYECSKVCFNLLYAFSLFKSFRL